MRTSMNIPKSLLEKAKEISGVKTQTDAVIVALSEYINRHEMLKILDLKGSMADDYDYKKARKRGISRK